MCRPVGLTLGVGAGSAHLDFSRATELRPGAFAHGAVVTGLEEAVVVPLEAVIRVATASRLRWRWAGWSVVGVLAHLAARRSGPDRHRDLPAWALTVAGPTPLA